MKSYASRYGYDAMVWRLSVDREAAVTPNAIESTRRGPLAQPDGETRIEGVSCAYRIHRIGFKGRHQS